mgnify:CR=1 FL=1
MASTRFRPARFAANRRWSARRSNSVQSAASVVSATPALNVNGGIENCPVMECHRPFEQDVQPFIRNPLKLENGMVRMPEKPGLGIDLDWNVIDNMTEKTI